jgi:hypothetical protein
VRVMSIILARDHGNRLQQNKTILFVSSVARSSKLRSSRFEIPKPGVFEVELDGPDLTTFHSSMLAFNFKDPAFKDIYGENLMSKVAKAPDKIVKVPPVPAREYNINVLIRRGWHLF